MNLLHDAVILLGFALVFVLLFRRLGLGATLGFLIAGARRFTARHGAILLPFEAAAEAAARVPAR